MDKKAFILFLFIVSNICLSAQNKVLNFKTRNISVKEEIDIPQRIVASHQNYVELEYRFEEVASTEVKKDNQTFQWVKMKGFGLMNDVGKPALPCYNDILAVPAKDGLSIQIIESEYTDFENFNIHPALKLEKDGEKDTTKQRFILDKQTYSSNVYFPEKIVEIASIRDYREVPLAFVQIRPVQYNPKTKKLRCYSKIKYRITFENQNSIKAVRTEQESFDVLRNVLSNPDMLETLSTKNQTGQLRSGSISGKNYIIVTTDKFLPAVQEFAAWKIRMGHSCEIVSQASWTTSQVKNAVHTRYQNWDPKPEYLLIVGDHPDVPGEIGFWGDCITDLYYVCMGDGGAYFDYTADMARGRVSVNSLEQAYLVLRKIINYERNPITDASFYQVGLNCALFEDNKPRDGYDDRRCIHTSEEVRDYMISKGKIVNRVYATSYPTGSDSVPKYYNDDIYSDGQPIPSELRPPFSWDGNHENITNEINAGRFYVLYRGHGTYTSWSNPSFYNDRVRYLNNGNKLPVVFSICCQTGMYYKQNTVCFAEELIRHPQGGAVGVFAASETSYTGYNDGFVVGMFDAIWSNPGLVPQFGSGVYNSNLTPYLNPHTDIYKMGSVMNQGLFRMGYTWGRSSYGYNDVDIQYTNEIFHYFGDPSMEMYTASPSSFTNPLVSQSGTTVTVNTGGVSGCKIALTSMDYGESYFDVRTNVSSATFTNVTMPYYVTITKHNYIPYTYPQDIYIQNETITENSYISGRNIYVGRAVTGAKPQGDVIISNNANVIFDATQDVVFDNGFECTLGAEFEVIQK